MTEEQKTEVDMDVFSRRISPYFTWLESRIESGWKQSESFKKNILKETRMIATNMRAKFILGVDKEEFKQELEKAMELFELALDAFPDYSSEVESKMQHFAKGISTEIGPDVLPNGFTNGVQKEEPKIQVKKAKVKKAKVKVEKSDSKVEKKVKKARTIKKETKVEEKVKKAKKKAVKKSTKAVKKTVKKEEEVEVKPEIIEPVIEKKEEHKEHKEPKTEEKPKESRPKKPNPVFKWFRNTIFGDDLD
jgi:hypothetical protein